MLRYIRALERQRLGAGPQHDSAGLLHHEAQCHQRDDSHHLARVRATSTPSRPQTNCQGYTLLDAQLRAWLCQATGYAGISLQPNAGSQGEYAGLLVIRAYHAANGQGHRNICLIPSSRPRHQSRQCADGGACKWW
jgi:glycine cleavage system protein P-like pyridoxal-binding family